MANLIIKPTSGGSLVLQDEGGSAAMTVAAAGTTTFAENATFSGTANNLGTVTAGTLGSAVVFPAGMMRFVTEIYTNTADTESQAGQVVTTGALAVTIGSKIRLQILIGFEDQDSDSGAYHDWYLTGDNVGASTSGHKVAGGAEYNMNTNERGFVGGSFVFTTTTATPTYGVWAAAAGTPNIDINHSALTVYEIYQ